MSMKAKFDWAAYRKAFRDIHGKFCECGRPAVAYRGNGFVCARCTEIEKKMYRANPDSQAAYVTRERKARVAVEPFAIHLPGFA